jgi:hypothetical protein
MRTISKIALPAIAGIFVGVIGSSLLRARILKPKAIAPVHELSPYDWQQRYLAQVAAEGHDRRWSEQAATDLQAWFDQHSKMGVTAHVDRIDCRTHSCAIGLSWKNLSAARRDSDQITRIGGGSLSGCTSLLYLTPIEATPYRAPLTIVDCTS